MITYGNTAVRNLIYEQISYKSYTEFDQHLGEADLFLAGFIFLNSYINFCVFVNLPLPLKNYHWLTKVQISGKKRQLSDKIAGRQLFYL